MFLGHFALGCSRLLSATLGCSRFWMWLPRAAESGRDLAKRRTVSERELGELTVRREKRRSVSWRDYLILTDKKC